MVNFDFSFDILRQYGQTRCTNENYKQSRCDRNIEKKSTNQLLTPATQYSIAAKSAWREPSRVLIIYEHRVLLYDS